MSVKIVNKQVYECRCELPDCPSGGEPWYSKELVIPKRCQRCHRYTWNGVDRRVPDNPQPDPIREYNRRKQAEARARRRQDKQKQSRKK